jgi:radical SAM/Cys-rich protein
VNRFEEMVASASCPGLCGQDIETVQVNVGLRCNQSCAHCHLGASPDRTEMMAWHTMERIVVIAGEVRCQKVDITGGAPEMHRDLRRFIEALTSKSLPVQVRTNLTAICEPGNETYPAFFRDHKVQLVGSMPCYLEENVTAQRGPGVYQKSIECIRKLNEFGYGLDPELALNLVYNPGGPFLPPAQDQLEADYKRELGDRFGIEFTHLLTITNMPIGRFLTRLRQANQDMEYRQLLEASFNPDTIDALMCRHQVSIGWDGTLYDCDFNLALGMPVNHGAPDQIENFEESAIEKRRIVTAEHCFGCTAGAGSSCGGALA